MEWMDGIVYMCPCDNEQRYITSPPHTISFDADGILTLIPSIGYKARQNLDRPQNWCHFFIKDGVVEMCSDAQCPGANL